jgi:predicted site-specific integrase-resolvase
MHLSVSAAADYLGVSISTLRRWHHAGSFEPDFLTCGGHRRYSIKSLKQFCQSYSDSEAPQDELRTVLYARVSSSDQKQDLSRQCERLSKFASEKDFSNCEIIQDLGSGVNYKKPGLKRLLKMLINDQVQRLVLHHKDRLLRFGSELIFTLCRYLKVEVIVLEETIGSSFEEELVADVIEIITVFSSRLYGRRSHANRQKLLPEVA